MIETILTVIVGLVVLACLFLSWNYNYWKRKGLPQPPVKFGFGNLYDAFLGRRSPGMIYDEIYRSYPANDAVGVYGIYTPRLLLRSPALIKKVLVSDFSSFHDNEFQVTKKQDPYFYKDPFSAPGDDWKVYRTKLVSTMTPNKLKETFPIMKESIPRLDAYLNEQLNKDVEAKALSTLFTMDIVSNIVFGVSSNCFSDPNAAFRRMGAVMMVEQLQSWWKVVILFMLPNIRNLIGIRVLPVQVAEFIEGMVQEVKDYRTKNNISRNDIFQQILKKEAGSPLEEIAAHAAIYFVEGFETASMVSSMTLYELALNPEVQQTLYEEVKDAFGDSGDFDYDTLNSLPYIDKVLQESQRKYPVLFNFVRLCTKKTTLEIDGKNVDIEPNTPVVVPTVSLHHDPQYFPDPEVFDPERFSEESKAARPPYTYMPFGEGPRICPGQRFGLTQVKLFISNIVLKYKILRTQQTPAKLTMNPAAFLGVPIEEPWIGFEKRK